MKGLQDFYLEAKARLSYVCHIHSTAGGGQVVDELAWGSGMWGWSVGFRGGLIFKAHRLLYHSTLGLVVIKKKFRAHLRHVVRAVFGSVVF